MSYFGIFCLKVNLNRDISNFQTPVDTRKRYNKSTIIWRFFKFSKIGLKLCF